MESSTKGNDTNGKQIRAASGQLIGDGNIEIAGAVFVMIVFGIINVVSAVQFMYFFGFHGLAQTGIPTSIVFGALLFVSAYFGLKFKLWAFVVPIVLGAIDIMLTPVVDGFNNNIPVWDTILLVAGFLTFYTSFLGLVKVRSLHYRT